MFPKSHLVFLATLLLTTTQLSAQTATIATDGTLTLGLKTNLPGSPFRITPDLGQQHGGNLFHSFEVFNLKAGESATFTGPANVENILARVTGGQRSLIDGTLRSEIPNANLYLLNPSGILFGKNARLDISGSFHASTADYIRLTDGSSFYARPDSNPALLSVARPEAFGFLRSEANPITIQGSHLAVIPRENNKGRTLSIIGGDLTIDDATLNAPAGRVNLVAVASKGEVMVSDQDLKIDSFEKMGTITLLSPLFDPERQLANIDVSSANGGGQIFLRAGHFFANHASLFADNYGGNQNGSIDISVRGEMRLSNSTKITAGNFGTNPQSGSIRINALGSIFLGLTSEELEQILTQTGVPPITPEFIKQNPAFKNFFFSNIGTGNCCSGTGGDISITTPVLEVSYGLIESFTTGSGRAGNIQVNASQVNLHDYGLINAAVGERSGSGHAGNIRLRDIDGINPVHQISLSNNSTISVATATDSSGDAGNIDLKTQELVLTDGAQINSFSYGLGKAGSINIEANKIWLTNQSGIHTEADFSGGGDITLQVHDWLQVVDSKIKAEARGTKSQDNGGNITIQGNLGRVNSFSLINSQLLANANRGHGGAIDLYADKFTLSNSEIDVSSRGGFNGSLFINSFRLQETIFPQRQPLGGERLFSSRCATFSKENLSRFIITARDILPRSPEDLRTHSLRLPRRGR